MDERLLYAALALVAGVAVGALAGAMIRRLITMKRTSKTSDEVATSAAAFVFWVVLAIGIAVAVGILSPGAVDPIAEETLAYLPNVLIAVLLLIAGRAIASIAGSALGAGIARATGRTRREATLGLRAIIMIVTIMLALAQLGVNTMLLTIVAAAALFGTAAAMALLIGLGGRDVARELAAGRYLRRILTVGDDLSSDDFAGRVVTLHAATTEFETTTGTIHVPNTRLLAHPLTIQRPGDDSPS